MIKLSFCDLKMPPVSSIISLTTRHMHNHVESISGNGDVITCLPFLGVVTLRGISPLGVNREIVEISCTEEQAKIYYDFLQSQHGKDYDWSGVLGFHLPWRVESRKKWFCSEIVAAGLIKAGLINGTPYRFSPASLYEICKSL